MAPHSSSSCLQPTSIGDKRHSIRKMLKAYTFMGFLPLKFENLGLGVSRSNRGVAMICCLDIFLSICKYQH